MDINLPAPRAIRLLDRIAAWRGYPRMPRLDNGPELVSVAMADWAGEHEVVLDFIQPGKPTQNSYIERFNRTYREEVRAKRGVISLLSAGDKMGRPALGNISALQVDLPVPHVRTEFPVIFG